MRDFKSMLLSLFFYKHQTIKTNKQELKLLINTFFQKRMQQDPPS